MRLGARSEECNVKKKIRLGARNDEGYLASYAFNVIMKRLLHLKNRHRVGLRVPSVLVDVATL